MNNKSETELAMFLNNATYNDYYDRLKLIATSLFTWDGLEEVAGTGSARFLELCLYIILFVFLFITSALINSSLILKQFSE